MSFAGGNVHVAGADPFCAEDWSYGTAGNTRSGAGVTGVCGDPPGAGGAGAVECSGTLTATFIWVPDFAGDNPPPYVAVHEVAEARWDGDGGSCANGLGSPATGSLFAQTSLGERWTLRPNPGLTFQVSLVGAGADTIWNTGACGNPAGTATVSWQVTAHPIDIQLGGTLVSASGGHSCMVGQQVVATLVAPSFPDNWRSWSIPKGGAFADYQVAPPAGDTAVVSPYANGQTGLSTSAFFRAPGLAMFKCNLFLGGPIQQQLSLQKNLGVDKPENDRSESIGTVQLSSANQGPKMGLYYAPWLEPADKEWDAADWVGVRWRDKIETPPVHWNAPFTDSGVWHFVQLMVPARFHVLNGTYQWHTGNGYLGLDTVYPYVPEPHQSPNPGTFSCGESASAGDSPALATVSPPRTMVRALGEQFRTYAMYRPPARATYETRWVAVWRLDWHWTGESYYVNGAWTDPVPGGRGLALHSLFPTQPQWLLRHLAEGPWEP